MVWQHTGWEYSSRRGFLSTLGVAGGLGLFGSSTATENGPETPSDTRSASPGEDDVPPLEPHDIEWISERLVEFTFENPLVDPPLARVKVRVLLPPDYDMSRETYPTLYLLHGHGDTAAGWTTKASGEDNDGDVGPLQEYFDHDAVVVMPDGGKDDYAGWYSDWFNDGQFGPPMWETFHIRQLIPFIERNFRVRSERGGRIVAGLSMGGFGALKYAARHPDLFAGAYSFSGAPLGLETQITRAENDDYPIDRRRAWGDPREQRTRLKGHLPTYLVENYQNTRLWFTIGEGKPGGPAPTDDVEPLLDLEQRLYRFNEQFADALDSAGVDYHYETFEQRSHNWYWWHKDLQRAWPDMKEVFESDTEDPAQFSYKSIEPSFEVWDWHVDRQDLDRRTAEFLHLENVTPDGLTVRGWGMTSLVTPRYYRPGADYELSVEEESAAVRPTTVQADESGRLEFSVRVGPAANYAQSAPDKPQSATITIEPTSTGMSGNSKSKDKGN